MPETVDYERLEPIPASYGCAGIVLSIAFFQTLNQTVLRGGCPKAVGRENYWKWRNLVVSWIHALIVGVWDITCFYRYPEIAVDPIAYHNTYIYAMVSFSAGYFIHDTIDIVVNGQSSNMWEVIPHHIAVGGMFVLHLVTCRYIAYSAVALLAEINSFFLHFRKLLQMAGASFTRLLYRVNAAANLFTFVTCRFVCLIWIGYGVIFWRSRVSWVYLVAITSACVVMYIINVVLFWRLLCSDVLGRRRTRPKLDARQEPITAYRVISDSTVPVSVEDVRLACCHPADSISKVSRSNESLDGMLITNSTRHNGTSDSLPIPKVSPPFHDVADHMNLMLRSHATSPSVW